MDQHITVHIQKGEGFIPDSTVHEEMKCPFCPKKYAKLSSVNKNISLAHANCLYCPEKFESQKDMCAHAMKCQFSPAKFLTNKDMGQHELTRGHTVLDLKKPIPHDKCKFCHKFVESTDMDKHIAIFHKTIHEEIKCLYCPEKFVSPKDMCAHTMKCQFSPGRTISYLKKPIPHDKCKFCHKFVESTAMDEHIALLHAIKCSFCPEKFAKGADMDAHVTSVHYIKCQFCPAKCFSEKDMDQHITQAHVTTSNHP